jgi:hypothetical protein
MAAIGEAERLPMKKQVLILLALASVAQAVAQTHPVRVKLRVVLI